MTTPTGSALGAIPAKAARDPRLDFFRGIAMFIILVAHTPGNTLTLWIPARFGFSDATEIFVFCSGMASAIAFGRVFDTRGWWMGTARVAQRVWQVYWAHICVFFTILAIMAFLDNTGMFEKSYRGSLNLFPFFKRPAENLPAVFTLTYIPNYLDILPMYLVILAMMPLVMGLSRVSLGLTAAFIGLVWLLAQRRMLETVGLGDLHLALPAEPWSDRNWFFNPFGWQLVFFTGFAFMRGWLKPPPVKTSLIILAAVIVLLTVPVAYFRIRREFVELKEIYSAIPIVRTKSDFGVFRYVHFLAVAYLAWVAVGPGGRRLIATGQDLLSRFWARFVATVQMVGQQSLAVFVFSLVAARLLGFMMDQIGRNNWVTAGTNLFGFALIIAVAFTVRWFKSQPWRKKVT